jgi:ethanolamine utilization protein EutA
MSMKDITPTDGFVVHAEEGVDVAPNPDWLRLTSVGIDIGSSTSHLTFSELVMHREGTNVMTSHYQVVERNVLYRSPILLTPYSDPDTIDMKALESFVDQCYAEAHLTHDDTNTGAVISTGEAVRKKNAEAIVRLFAAKGGKFVCATAGPHLEGVLAAHGSGSVASSLENPGKTVMNVDMGGGTSKVTVARDGEIVETGAINIGARLIAWDADGKLVRIENAGRHIAESIGLSIELGQVLTDEQRGAMAQKEAEILVEYMSSSNLSPLATDLVVTDTLEHARPADALLFSGGVSEYIYQNAEEDYGDLGPLLAEAMRGLLTPAHGQMVTPTEMIRATVIGASQYTVQLSSSTIYISDPAVLPALDRQVVAPHIDEKTAESAESVAKAIKAAIQKADLNDFDHERSIALYIHWPLSISYDTLRALSGGIVAGMEGRKDDPWVIVFDTDIGALAGAMIKEEFGIPQAIVATDEVVVKDLDFIDIGEEVKNRHAVPVVVKSLVFG